MMKRGGSRRWPLRRKQLLDPWCKCSEYYAKEMELLLLFEAAYCLVLLLDTDAVNVMVQLCRGGGPVVFVVVVDRRLWLTYA